MFFCFFFFLLWNSPSRSVLGSDRELRPSLFPDGSPGLPTMFSQLREEPFVNGLETFLFLIPLPILLAGSFIEKNVSGGPILFWFSFIS